jgi:hypothetical protein
MTKRLLLQEQPARRGFLRTLITAPAAALATHRLILPGEISPEERARRAWAEFSAAMREMTAGDDGWVILGAGERKPFRHLEGHGPAISLRAVQYVEGAEPLAPKLIVERHREISL